MLILALLACSGSQTIVEADPADTGAASAVDTAVETGEAPRDLDEDGYPAGEDCMDLNPAVHPGADEIWNGLDDDCDGLFDADGSWAGSTAVQAVAVYEGRRYSFLLDCPFTGVRGSGAFDWIITCTPDPGDDKAQLLLGASLTLRPKDSAVELERWDGDAIVESSEGWDTNAEAAVEWSSFDRATLAASLSAASLDLGAEATITRQ